MSRDSHEPLGYDLSEKYPELTHFLGVGFHQHADLDGDEADQVRYTMTHDAPHHIEAYRQELERFLSEDLSEEQIEDGLRQAGVAFDFIALGWESNRALLEQLLQWLTEGVPEDARGKIQVERNASVRASSYPDRKTADEVVDEAIRAKADEIREWLESLGGPMSRRRYMSDYDAGRVVGRLVEQRVARVQEGPLEGAVVPTDGTESGSGSVEMDVTCVRSVFVHDPDFEHGWRVHTTYPVERVSNPFLRRRWPHLDQMLSAYFHQDWPEDYGDIAGAAIHYVQENPPAVIEATREELDEFRDEFQDASEEELGEAIEFGFGAEFHAPAAATTFREFLDRLDDLLEAERRS